jgi:nucleotide-binding universal stress UspA family protein
MSSEPIVAGTDGSPTAELAVEKAAELARALGAELHLVSCHKNSSSGALMAAASGVPVPLDPDHDAAARSEAILARTRERLAAAGVRARIHVCSGDPAQALVSIAEDEGAQMIVVGNRGMTGTRRVLGSVPNSVSHHARCDVLIVPTC